LSFKVDHIDHPRLIGIDQEEPFASGAQGEAQGALAETDKPART
jgi:hypothetical protein